MSGAAELVRRWNDGGEQLLFDALLPHVADAAEPSSIAVVYDYASSIFAHTIPSFHDPPLPRAHAAALLERLLQSLPSSSSGSQDGDECALALRDTLIDVIWSLDTLFDDKLVELAAQIKAREVAAAEDPSKTSEVQSPKDQRAAVERERKDFAQLLNELLSRGVLQLAQCRSRLDFGLLAAAGLITNKVLLEKKEIQTRTRLFYKQNKFNLLREQSEGYSKLAVELLASIPAPHGVDARPIETDEDVQNHARIAWDNIVTLIGYFDLDPNRALDVILDAFSTNVVHHHSFFIALLRLSPWCNRPVARDGERMNVEVTLPAGASVYTRKSFDNVLRVAQGLPELEDDEMELDEAAKVSVCSQVLGFKFAYYASSPRVDAPRSLFLVAAILTREGLIALEDILPHLTPVGDDDMKDARTKFEKECAEKISNARASALAMAAPLTDDTTTKSGKTADQERQAARTEVNQQDQRTQYIHALLAVGALVPAFDLLSLTPWVVSAAPEIADLLLRTAHHSLQPLYQQYHSRNSRLSAAVSGTKKKFSPSAGLASATPLKQILTAWAPPPPSTTTTEYVFFFPAWVDWVPLCTVHSDVEHILEPILRFIGPLLHRETEFMAKLCRIGKIQVAGRNNPTMEFWATLARLYLLPGMSLLHNNLTIAVEVWSVLGAMDTMHRWALYGDWATRSYQLYPELRIRKVEADREARAIMRRLGSKNVQTLARAVGKLAHSNPCILFANMVNQVMAYDNLAEVVTDSLKFCTMLPFDVLMYTVLSAFADPDKERVKEDGISVSAWLQSLASFTGLLCRRHYQLDHSLVMQYVVNRLRMEQVNDIIVLRELIAKTTGINPVEDLSSDAIVALTGGPTLRIEATASTSRGAGVDKVLLQTKATERLVAAFNQHGLGRTILILTGRQAHGCVFMQPQVQYLKSLSTLYDSVQQVQAQLIDCLSTTLSPQAYSRLLPSVEELCGQYGVNIYSVMQIYRPKLLHDILVHIDAFRSVDAKPAESAEEAERRLKAALAAKRGETAAAPAPASVTTDQKTSSTALDTTVASTGDMPSPPLAAELTSPWLPPLEPIIRDVASVLPPNVAAVLGAPFFVTFWQLSLLDLRPPMDHYKAQTDRLSKELKAKNDELKTTTRGSRDIKAKRDRIQAAVDSLVKETAAVMHNMEFTRGRLSKEKAHWFTQAMNNRELAPQIVQHCITPRALLSPMDADFCSFFIKTLHLTATPGFHTLGILDGIFKSFGAAIVFSCSGNEARNYGRFLKNVLGDLMTWNKTQDCFMDKNKGILPGFSIIRGVGRPLTQTDIMDPAGLKRFTRKCHARLTAGLTSSIKDGEYMGVYNSIVILNELSDVLPLAEISAASGDIIHSTIKECIEKETREDLKILAQAYLAKLGQRRKLWENQTTSDDASKSSVDKPRPALTVPDNASPVPSRPQSSVPPSGSNSSNARSTQSELDRTSSSSDPKAILSNIPRPDVVKRVSREPPRQEQVLATSRPTPSSTNGTHSPAPRDGGLRAPAGLPMKPDLSHRGGPNGSSAHSSRPPSPNRSGPSTSTSRREHPPSPRSHRPSDDHISRPTNPSMPPPGAPSSTATAQDLRRTSARDERDARAPPRGPHSSNAPRGSSPPARRPSPRSSRDTRDAPVPSRHDDRALGSDNPRVSHDAPGRPANQPRDEIRDSRDRPLPGRGREGDRGSDDRQHERDRHYQPESRDREADRRPAGLRPEDEQSRRAVATASIEEQAGSKRRRHSEDESVDRSSKRAGGSSRHKDSSSHRDDRTRHRSEKERDREAGDKRGHRKERERRDDGGRDRESRGNDDRPPRTDAAPQNSKPAPPPPSQPRAMASGDSQRPPRQESSSRRADSPRTGPEVSRGSASGNLSLRDRIGGAAGGDSGGSRDGSLKRPHDAAGDGRDSDGDSGRKRQRIVRGRYRDAISASQLGGSGPPPPE